MTTVIENQTAPAVTLDEAEAAQLEGAMTLPAELGMLYAEAKALKAMKDTATVSYEAKRDQLSAALKEHGVRRFTNPDGSTAVLLTKKSRPGFDTTAAKARYPGLFARYFARFIKVTKYDEVTVK